MECWVTKGGLAPRTRRREHRTEHTTRRLKPRGLLEAKGGPGVSQDAWSTESSQSEGKMASAPRGMGVRASVLLEDSASATKGEAGVVSSK